MGRQNERQLTKKRGARRRQGNGGRERQTKGNKMKKGSKESI